LHRLALLVCLAPIVAAGCSQKQEAAPAPKTDYGSGLVSMEIVQRDMAARRAQAAAAAPEASTRTEESSAKRPDVLEPRSRNGIVPVSTRVIVKPAPGRVAPARVTKPAPAAEPAATASAPTPSTEAAATAALIPPATAVPAALTMPDAAPTALAAPTTPGEAAPLFPSATVAARKLSTVSPTSSPTEAPALSTPPAAAFAAPVVTPPALFTAEDVSPIYSKADAGVTPARLLTTTSTAGLSMDATDVNTMELVINKLGRVEQVRLAGQAKRMTDMLLLSGAKLWKFEPATKDGQPVRYRTTVSWQTTR
jgi:hypothetical protein